MSQVSADYSRVNQAGPVTSRVFYLTWKMWRVSCKYVKQIISLSTNVNAPIEVRHWCYYWYGEHQSRLPRQILPLIQLNMRSPLGITAISLADSQFLLTITIITILIILLLIMIIVIDKREGRCRSWLIPVCTFLPDRQFSRRFSRD